MTFPILLRTAKLRHISSIHYTGDYRSGRSQMLVVMQSHATEEQVREVCRKIEALGLRAHPIPGAQRTAIGITGNPGAGEPGSLEEMPGVGDVIRVSRPCKQVSRALKAGTT